MNDTITIWGIPFEITQMPLRAGVFNPFKPLYVLKLYKKPVYDRLLEKNFIEHYNENKNQIPLSFFGKDFVVSAEDESKTLTSIWGLSLRIDKELYDFCLEKIPKWRIERWNNQIDKRTVASYLKQVFSKSENQINTVNILDYAFEVIHEEHVGYSFCRSFKKDELDAFFEKISTSERLDEDGLFFRNKNIGERLIVYINNIPFEVVFDKTETEIIKMTKAFTTKEKKEEPTFAQKMLNSFEFPVFNENESVSLEDPREIVKNEIKDELDMSEYSISEYKVTLPVLWVREIT